MIFKKSKNKKPKRRYKNKSCIIHFEKDIYSDKAIVEIYGSEIDIEIGLLGIFVAYINRGHTFDDIRDIINKMENNGREVL